MSRKADLVHQAHQCEQQARITWLNRLDHVASRPVPTCGELAAEKVSRLAEAQLAHQARQCWDEVQVIADEESAGRVWPPEEPYWRGDF